jgi:hypothetical protein
MQFKKIYSERVVRKISSTLLEYNIKSISPPGSGGDEGMVGNE